MHIIYEDQDDIEGEDDQELVDSDLLPAVASFASMRLNGEEHN